MTAADDKSKPLTGAERTARWRANAALRKQREEAERSVLGEIGDALVEVGQLGAWDSEDLEMVRKKAIEAIRLSGRVTSRAV